MLGDWSTRYRPGGMNVVAHPAAASASTPNTPLLPELGDACAGAAAASGSTAQTVATTVRVAHRCRVITTISVGNEAG
jgi:hypothetical protein